MDIVKPYSYQKRIAERFSEGSNLLLHAPPGAGKTRAAIEPILHGFDHDRHHASYDFPPRALFAVPMRTLARGQYATALRLATDADKGWQREWQPRIQTGEQPEDSLFESKLVFATVDQVLASFISLPYTLPRRLDNINIAAMIGSYLIFDEFHLYPRQEMLLSVLAMLRLLKGISRFTLMTATCSLPLRNAIARLLDAELIHDEPDTLLENGVFHDVKNVLTQQRTWQVADGALNADAVLRLRGRRTLCVCNTVDRAQQLLRDVQARLPGVECRLLHGRFYPADRRVLEQFLLEDFEHSTGEVILIATQVVEVGIDISADVLLTECAPASSLIQRAGRCARRAGERGRVVVFQPLDEEGNVNYAPYHKDDEGDDVEAICQKTWETLTGSNFDGRVLRFAEEQALVEAAHHEADAQFADGLDKQVNARIDQIIGCLAVPDDGYLHIIRSQSTVPLYVHSHPKHDKALTEKPWGRASISFSRGQLAFAFKRWQEAGLEADFYLMGCNGVSQETDEEAEDERVEKAFIWEPIKSDKEIYGGRYRWFVAHPSVISYTAELGLLLQPSDAPAPVSPLEQAPRRETSAYTADRYGEHISGLFRAYSLNLKRGQGDQERLFLPLRDEFLYPLTRLCAQMNLNSTQGERLMRLVIALHDVGKLNRPWQAWAKSWQGAYVAAGLGWEDTLRGDDAPLAHTDYDPTNAEHRQLKQNFRHAPRGTHAVESARAALPILQSIAGKEMTWLAVMVAAIMCHHTPDARESGSFHMVAGGERAIADGLRACGFATEADALAGSVSARFEHSSGLLTKCIEHVRPTRQTYRPMLLYALFVRILRLADQRSSDALRGQNNHP